MVKDAEALEAGVRSARVLGGASPLALYRRTRWRVRGGAFCAAAALAFFAGAASAASNNAGWQKSAVGHPTFASPHFNPIAVAGGFVYVANTPADTVDVIDASRRRLVRRIAVGIDPVSIAVRPDGSEVWVANHVSDTVSVIDANPESPFFHHVVATVQDIHPERFSTRFDEPVGVAFASNQKAYVALSTSNRIAVVDVAARAVTGHLPIRAQDPRAIAVRGNRLYVLPFESNNQTQLSGCLEEDIDGDVCTFDAVEHVFSNNNVLSLGYDADIVKNRELPDRDIFVFDTTTDRPTAIVNSVGTLLYGVAVDSRGRVFVAQTEARNDANGRAGTLGHALAEMENRAFLNQIARVDCGGGNCSQPVVFDLEPLPPLHPAAGRALATPFAIQVSDDDAVLVATAAGSDKLFTVDAESGRILGRVSVGAAPRGVALVSNDAGAPRRAWVLNAVGNSVSLVTMSSPRSLKVVKTIALEDPTPALAKQGRIAFNDADASSTGTFSCESCHPDNHTDQLIWVLETPPCARGEGAPADARLDDGCTQVPPRLTMPVRGLRDTEPYHWDGIPGDPYGGNNTASINVEAAPNCSIGDAAGCARVLVDGSMGTTMCDMADCPANDEGKAGLLDGAARDALANFILSVPFPPAPSRPFDNVLTPSAQAGFHEFNFVAESADRTTGAQTCGACHRMPFLVSTNTPGTGMDAPTWRGAYERWMITPQARTNIIDLMQIVSMDGTFPERDMWILGGASEDIWQMVLQGSTGFSGTFGRQVTLDADTAGAPTTTALLRALERSARDGAVVLQGDGAQLVEGESQPLALEFVRGKYRVLGTRRTYTRTSLVDAATAGELVLTLTARAGPNVDFLGYPQPALWPPGAIEAQTRTVEIPFLSDDLTLRVNGRHVLADAAVYVDGRRVAGSVRCESGALPACDDEILLVQLEAPPRFGGLRFLQLQNAGGLFSNDMLFFSEQAPRRDIRSNLVSSRGHFGGGTWDNGLNRLWRGERRSHWNTVVNVDGEDKGSVSARGGLLHVTVNGASDRPWHVQLSHPVSVVGGQQYTLCYRARASAPRFMTAYADTNTPNWRNTSGQQFRADLTTSFQRFAHTFTIEETDLTGRIAFDFAQSDHNVQIDDIGLYEGASCGRP